VQSPQPDQSRKKYERQSSYDPNSAFHVIGSGELTEAQREKLTEREKKALDTISDQRGLP
jgi:hypothetical protein